MLRSPVVLSCAGVPALHRILHVARRALVVAAVSSVVLDASAARWDPIPPAILQATDSATKPGTDVEILQSIHKIEEKNEAFSYYIPAAEGENTVFVSRYVRAKVYTAKGVEDQGKLSIDLDVDETIGRIEGRVVKPDGTSSELKKSDIFETEVARKPWEKRKQYTFAFPGLAPGDVVEYRWNISKSGGLAGAWFFCQERVPVAEYKFIVGQRANKGQVMWFNCPEVKQDLSSEYVLSMRNLPAFEPEPDMPAEREYRAWILIARQYDALNDKDLWDLMSREWNDSFLMASKPSGAIKAKAAELLAGAATDDEKLLRLAQFCLDDDEFMHVNWRTSAAKQDAIQKLVKEDGYRSAGKTFDDRIGRPGEINRLFAALARAAGFEVRLARNVDKTELVKVNSGRSWAFFDHEAVMIKQGEQWRYFDPGSFFLPAGMMAWWNEGAVALQCSDRKIEFGVIPQAASTRSQAVRKGRFALDAEGNLEGTVEITLTGHPAAAAKREHWGMSAEEDAKAVQDEVNKRLPNAEVTEVVWSNLHDNVHPVSVKYHLRVPGYAEQAGARLVLTPAVFSLGRPVDYTEEKRTYPIVLPFAREEHDDVEIVLPEGFALDNAGAPQPVGDVKGALGVAYRLGFKPKARAVSYRRDFTLGADGSTGFRPESYGTLRGMLNAIHSSDQHSVMIKAAAPAPAPAVQP